MSIARQQKFREKEKAAMQALCLTLGRFIYSNKKRCSQRPSSSSP
ncbi:hypothetical protein J3D56_000325 [Erwinia persicina]|uniref:Uncharacterized protein n=1 Tax=Erwinia aeris TaxID=3239803 RepID=A0ABV4E395_9GAMM|nr:hypothetical protein [Erwinia persicina]MCP1436889.1 hypothetical protein [Erwinia persicina]